MPTYISLLRYTQQGMAAAKSGPARLDAAKEAYKKAGGELAQLEVDAHMPAHRHGMNYLPSVTTSSAGRHRAEGLMFHMPGRWEFVFVLRAGGAVERLTHAVTLD